MDFWFEFLDIYMTEKTTTYHDCHGFKRQNINIFPILTFFRHSTSLLARLIMIAPS
jgi:hypothetical protein